MAGRLVRDPVPISRGGTGKRTKATAFDALSPTTTRGDLIQHNGTTNVRTALGAAGTLLRSDGSDAIYSTLTAFLDAVFTTEANGDLVGRTGENWTNRTLAAVLGDMLTARGQIIRRGSSAPEALAAQTANTFLGGDGTDVTTRTAAQVKTSLGLSSTDVLTLGKIGGTSMVIADDGVGTFTIPGSIKRCFLFIVGGTDALGGLFWIRTDVALSAIRSAGATMAVATGVRTGTTGADGSIYVSPHTDGNVYIENRSGASYSMHYSLYGTP